MTRNGLCLLQVHAHPDDEASKGAGVTARYADEGVRNVLVTATGGEAGDILNPAADTPETRARLHEIRIEELARSVEILGYDAVHLLGYRDSGMPDTEPNAHPHAFANAELDDAVGKLVAVIREERPQVLITYSDAQERYPHPDHLRVHDISVAAFDAAADPERYPDAGEPWQPLKLYYVGFTKRALELAHQSYEQAGIESPVAKWLDAFPDGHDERWRTRIDVASYVARKRESLLAHRTQIAPDWFWLRLPPELAQTAYRFEDFCLARSLVDPVYDGDGFETDLFSGIREGAGAR
ncbi:MAG TPA: mycothiol conjugate amidase Mca [Actinomycetota bacterium]